MAVTISITAVISPEAMALPAKLRSHVVNRVNLQAYNIAGRARRALEAAADNWSDPPTFSITGSLQQGEITIATDDLRYLWVDEGTRSHPIPRVRGRKRLAFITGYHPKTTPGRFTKGSGARTGSLVVVPSVWHPGIKARRITKRVAEVIAPQLERDFQRAIDDALR